MPGKYSHSVVLADYSSRGIIDLPDDQHFAYLRTSPYPASTCSRQNSSAWSDRSPVPQPRSQSALAYTNRHVSSPGRVSSASRHVIMGDDDDQGPLAESGLRSYDQRPFDTVNDSQSLPNRGRDLALKHLKELKHDHRMATPPPDRVAVPTSPRTANTSKTSSQPTKNQARTVQRENLYGASAPAPEQSPNSRQISQPISRPSTSRIATPKLQPAAELQTTVTNAAPVFRQSAGAGSQVSTPSQTKASFQRKSSQETQIFAPRSAPSELDFAGFSDSEEQAASYFESAPSPKVVRSHKSTAATVQSSKQQETLPLRKSSSRALESRAKTFRSMSTEPSDSENNRVSPAYSSSRLDSSTSISTMSSRGVAPTPRAVKNVELKKVTDPPIQDWKLPEIDEDGTFGPDFFTQGLDDPIPQTISNESVDSFLDRPLGTVSAGRDIDFSRDYDEESEADAACPPDIGRFRDDDAQEPSLLQTTKSNTLSGTGVSAVGQLPQAKTSGFFARFRNRSKARG